MILILSNQLSDVLCCFQFEYKYINILVLTLSSALYSNYHPSSDISLWNSVIHTTGAERASINTQVEALMPVKSDSNPAVMPPKTTVQ